MPVTVSYTTVSLMQMTLAEIGSISTMTDSVLLLHAGAAESIINAKLSKRYSLPFTSVIPLLETLATDMAIYRTLTGRITIREEHPWFARYKAGEDLLNQIVDGAIPLITDLGEVQAGRSDNSMQVWSNTMDYTPTFWEGPWTLQNQDEDKLEDEASDRDIDMLGGRLK